MGSETEVFAANNLEFCWAKSVGDISPDDWSRCFASHRFARSYAYQEAVEASAPSGVEFHYLLISKSDSIVAMVGCFRYRIPLSTTATGSARKVKGYCEVFIPELLSINGFIVGQLTVCDHLLVLSKSQPLKGKLFRCVSLHSWPRPAFGIIGHLAQRDTPGRYGVGTRGFGRGLCCGAVASGHGTQARIHGVFSKAASQEIPQPLQPAAQTIRCARLKL